MIHQLDIYGTDKAQCAIERLKLFEPKEGYYLAFSGGKDSVVCKALLDMAGVKYDAHYRVTSVDPPELIRFVKDTYPDVSIEVPVDSEGEPITMWSLIAQKHFPPTRIARYCCAQLKETGGEGRLTVTGVRWAESSNRKENHGLVTVMSKPDAEMNERIMGGEVTKTNRGGVFLNNDNEDSRLLVENCYRKHKTVLNPIIDWDDAEVWEFIREYNVPYCKLYDEGFKRLGCIGCPLGNVRSQEREFARWPKYKNLYILAMQKGIDAYAQKCPERAADYFQTGEEMFEWWTSKAKRKHTLTGEEQIALDLESEEIEWGMRE